ncbi:E3 SUMO-protein ligase MMS21 [Tripterygium wilfordii]|uniref:E3 SUMO-protein ligase MMS21 n=1 Tax=Tripterygium wilfordii TaxID=458696 RepID=A0A7J7C1P2_TRIWF|nr:E3 SUMO-protein ligase MMS21 [Tripterygium wilfordii]KAF5728043.1 E3 SUMO-protein ligase MMS21 [Tripterygium wilfordii]
MASTSASRPDGVTGRMRNAASTICSDNQSLIAEIRKALSMMRDIAVDLEKHNQFEKVKELEKAVAELVNSYEDCMHHSSAIQSVANAYQPGSESTDFKKLLEGEFVKLKGSSKSDLQNHRLMRQFREAIWNVHHAGQPMPGEEHEDIVMTSTQCNLLNFTCPLSGKPVTELAEPVRSVECQHIYDKKAIMIYLRSKNTNGQCPLAGCPKILQASKVFCDPLLLVEIDEMRAMSKHNTRTEVIEDFTALDEED